MLPKKQRLPIAEFLSKTAQIRRNASFTVKIFASSLPYSRYGVVISKKVLPKATGRNRIKRQIFAHCRTLTGSAHDVLIIVQKGAIIEELQKLL